MWNCCRNHKVFSKVQCSRISNSNNFIFKLFRSGQKRFPRCPLQFMASSSTTFLKRRIDRMCELRVSTTNFIEEMASVIEVEMIDKKKMTYNF